MAVPLSVVWNLRIMRIMRIIRIIGIMRIIEGGRLQPFAINIFPKP